MNHVISENKSTKVINKENLSSENFKSSISIKSYRQFVDLFYLKKEGMLHTYLYNNVKPVSFKEGDVTINIKSITDPHFSRTIAKLVSTWTGRIWKVNTSTSNIGQTLYEEDIIQQQTSIHIL